MDKPDYMELKNSTEVIHISSKSLSCNPIPEFPHEMYSPNGLILSNMSLLVCGFLNLSSEVLDCFILTKGNWEKSYTYPAYG